MRPEQAFVGKKPIVKVKGHDKGRKGQLKEVNLMSGQCTIQWDDTLLIEPINIYEFEYSKNGSESK